VNTIVLLGGPKNGTIYPVEDAPDSLLGYRKVRTVGSQPGSQTYLYLHESIENSDPSPYAVKVTLWLSYTPATDQVSVEPVGGKIASESSW